MRIAGDRRRSSRSCSPGASSSAGRRAARGERRRPMPIACARRPDGGHARRALARAARAESDGLRGAGRCWRWSSSDRAGSTDARDAMREALRLAPANERDAARSRGVPHARRRGGAGARDPAPRRRSLSVGRGTRVAGVRGDAGRRPAATSSSPASRATTRRGGRASSAMPARRPPISTRCSGSSPCATTAGTATADERRCLIGRLQRENRWANAYQVWLNSLPREQRQRVGYVFNGDFEAPLSATSASTGSSPPQERRRPSTRSRSTAPAGAAHCTSSSCSKRWAGPPVQQYLMLFPGRYRFEGRGRADGLDTWLGVQWGLYCLREAGRGRRGSWRAATGSWRTLRWAEFREEFTVPDDCPAQVLRLELANPRRDADRSGQCCGAAAAAASGSTISGCAALTRRGRRLLP